VVATYLEFDLAEVLAVAGHLEEDLRVGRVSVATGGEEASSERVRRHFVALLEEGATREHGVSGKHFRRLLLFNLIKN